MIFVYLSLGLLVAATILFYKWTDDVGRKAGSAVFRVECLERQVEMLSRDLGNLLEEIGELRDQIHSNSEEMPNYVVEGRMIRTIRSNSHAEFYQASADENTE